MNSLASLGGSHVYLGTFAMMKSLSCDCDCDCACDCETSDSSIEVRGATEPSMGEYDILNDTNANNAFHRIIHSFIHSFIYTHPIENE